MMMTALKQTHMRISRLDRTLITAVVLLSSIFPVELFSNAPPAAKGLDGQYSGKQGQVLVVTVKGEEQATEVKGTFLKRTIPFFREFRPGEPAGYIGLLGIDMQDEPGTYEFAVEVKQGEQAKQLSFNVLVAKEKFAVEHLTLPKEKVDLDENNRITILDGGRVVAEDSPDGLIAAQAASIGATATLHDVFMTYTGRSLDEDVEDESDDNDE